jgi:hypothetical protein
MVWLALSLHYYWGSGVGTGGSGESAPFSPDKVLSFVAQSVERYGERDDAANWEKPAVFDRISGGAAKKIFCCCKRTGKRFGIN